MGKLILEKESIRIKIKSQYEGLKILKVLDDKQNFVTFAKYKESKEEVLIKLVNLSSTKNL